jgi:hypothetical protein
MRRRRCIDSPNQRRSDSAQAHMCPTSPGKLLPQGGCQKRSVGINWRRVRQLLVATAWQRPSRRIHQRGAGQPHPTLGSISTVGYGVAARGSGVATVGGAILWHGMVGLRQLLDC